MSSMRQGQQPATESAQPAAAAAESTSNALRVEKSAFDDNATSSHRSESVATDAAAPA